MLRKENPPRYFNMLCKKKCMTASKCSDKQLLQSSLESSELSISTSSHDALVRCSQLRA